MIQVEIGHPIVRIRSDRGRKFDNVNVDLFCESKCVKHEFSIPRTPQQNRVTKRKNRVILEMDRLMIHLYHTTMQF